MNYTHTPAEIEELSRLLARSYASNLKPFNWRLALFENWVYASRYLEPPEYFILRVHLWRNPAGELVSFVIHGKNFIHLQLDYAYRFLETQMLAWVEGHRLPDQNQINLLVYNWDLERQARLADCGYQNLGVIEDVRLYDLNRPIPEPVLPPGFRFSTMAECGDSAALIELENQVWGIKLDENWFRGKSSAPSYSADLDLLVLAPDGQLAAHSLVWLYPHNQSAEIDPIGTHPEFRRLGLARALVLESFRRMRACGMQTAYIASETQDPVVSYLYASLDPPGTYQGSQWVKSFD